MSKSKTAPVQKRPATPKAEETLHGSSILAATFEIGGATVQLGDIVAGAFASHGGTVVEWNALADEIREPLLQAELDKRVAAANPIPAGSPADDDRQPAQAEAVSAAEVSADQRTGEGLEAASPDGGSAEAGAVESAPELFPERIAASLEEGRRAVAAELAEIRALAETDAKGAIQALTRQLETVRMARVLMDEAERLYISELKTIDPSSTHTAESEDLGGAGNAAGPAVVYVPGGMVVVTGPKQGRWRTGRHFQNVPSPPFEVTSEEFAALIGDPMLKVQVVPPT